jgi:hypothetical protein
VCGRARTVIAVRPSKYKTTDRKLRIDPQFNILVTVEVWENYSFIPLGKTNPEIQEKIP